MESAGSAESGWSEFGVVAPFAWIAATFSAVAGAATISLGDSPAQEINAAGARSQSPKHGERSQVTFLDSPDEPAGPSCFCSAEQSSSAPRVRHAMSSHTRTTTGGNGSSENIP